MTWFLENELVLQDETRILVDNGQFLLLLKVQERDFGSYRCELTNTLGTQRREINLTQKRSKFAYDHCYVRLQIARLAVTTACTNRGC